MFSRISLDAQSCSVHHALVLLHKRAAEGKSQALERLLDSRRIGVDVIRNWSAEQVSACIVDVI